MSAREQPIPFDPTSHPALAREANERIAAAAVRLRFVSRVPMQCECGDGGCRELFLIALDEYRSARADRATFITAPGHRLHGAVLREPAAGREYWLQRAA